MVKNPATERLFSDRRGRVCPRFELDAAVTMREMGYPPFDAQLRDISNSGFMVEIGQRLRPGCYVALALPGVGEMNGRVVWQAGAKAGGQFILPIDAARVVQAVKATDQPNRA